MSRGRAFLLAFVVFLCISIQPIRAEDNKVILADINGEITEATNVEISDILALSLGLDARLVVLRIDTPGGEANAVQSIMTAIEESSVPVCAFVSPVGATAWSGGTYILVSSDIAVMASGTSIGSAQPVLSTGTLRNDTKHINALGPDGESLILSRKEHDHRGEVRYREPQPRPHGRPEIPRHRDRGR